MAATLVTDSHRLVSQDKTQDFFKSVRAHKMDFVVPSALTLLTVRSDDVHFTYAPSSTR